MLDVLIGSIVVQERVGTVEKQKADLMLQQAFHQQQANGAGPSLAPQLPQQQQQGMQSAFGVAPGQFCCVMQLFLTCCIIKLSTKHGTDV